MGKLFFVVLINKIKQFSVNIIKQIFFLNLILNLKPNFEKKMDRNESVKKVNIRGEVTDLFTELEENIQEELKETGFTIMEEIENNYANIAINPEATSELLEGIKALLRDFPKKLLQEKTESQRSQTVQPKLRFKENIETQHSDIESACLNIEGLGLFATGDQNGTLILWDSETFKQVQKCPLNFPIKTLVFDSTAQRLILASASPETKDSLVSYKISEKKLDTSSFVKFECQEPISNLLLIEQERKLIVEDSSWRIHIWDLDTFKHVLDVKIDGDQWFTRGDGVAYLPESKLVVIPGADKQIALTFGKKKAEDVGTSTLRFFSIESGDLVDEKPLNFKTVEKMMFIKNKLVVLDIHGEVIFLDGKTFAEESRLEFEDTKILDAVFAENLDLLICTTDGPVVVLISFTEQKVLRKLHPRAISCEKSALYIESKKNLLVPFHLDESDFINIGILDLDTDLTTFKNANS